MCYSALQSAAVCCSEIHLSAEGELPQHSCSVLQCVAVCHSVLEFVAMLQCAAVCYSALQSAAVCCSEIHLSAEGELPQHRVERLRVCHIYLRELHAAVMRPRGGWCLYILI